MADQCKKGFKNVNGSCVRKVKVSKDKTSTGFDTSLAFYSLFGFLVIMLIGIPVLFGFNPIIIAPWTITFLMISAGIAFLYDGNLRRILADGKIKGRAEMSGFVTVIIGAFAIIVGIVSIPLFGIETQGLQVVTAIIAFIAFFTIIVQRWII